MAETIILATIHFCGGGGGEISHLPDFNADYNKDFRIAQEAPENEN